MSAIQRDLWGGALNDLNDEVRKWRRRVYLAGSSQVEDMSAGGALRYVIAVGNAMAVSLYSTGLHFLAFDQWSVVMKNILFFSFALVFSFVAQAQIQAEPGRTLKNPSDVLQNNQCVFRQKNIAALQGYDLIVDACDRRYTTSLVLVSDRMKPGMCAYDLLQNMTGYTLARVVKPCPMARNENPLIQNAYAEEPPLEEAELEEDVVETPQVEVKAEKAQLKKTKVQNQDEAMADIKGEVKPKKEKVVEVKPGEYLIAPDELDF